MKKYPFELLEVPGAENVRDLGGYPTAHGRRTARRRFIRAGDMSGLTTAGVQAVRQFGVGCVVDLRSGLEVRRKPDTLADDPDIAYVHIPMLDYIQSNLLQGDLSVFPKSMADMYIGLLEQGQADLLRAMEIYGDPAYNTVLFHCTAGKDRTGISAMLLLGLAGVSRETIVEDYSHSDRLITMPITADTGLPGYLFESRPETIEAAIDHLEKNYGGIQPYLAHIGVDGALRKTLLDKLLENPAE